MRSKKLYIFLILNLGINPLYTMTDLLFKGDLNINKEVRNNTSLLENKKANILIPNC